MKRIRIPAFGLAALAAVSVCAVDTTVATLDNPNGPVTVAAGDTLTVTGPVVSTGDSTSARFDKQGAGTLVLKGDNSFKRIKQSAGKLVFDGGATTVSGGTGAGQVGDGGNFLLDGEEVIITGGANVTIGAAGNSGTQYPILRSVSMAITNGTFDVSVNTAHTLCNFKNTMLPLKAEGQTVTIGRGGLFRVWQLRPFQPGTDASSYKDKYGFNIVDGGVLELICKDAIRIDGKQYGFVHFNGGVLANVASGTSVVPCYLYSGSPALATMLSTTADTWARARLSVGEGGAVISNAVSQKLYLPVPFRNAVSGGAADGGLHFSGKGTTYLYATGATYNGGTHLESTDGGILVLNATYGDTSLGTVPSSTETNIWVSGSNHTLFNQEGEFAIHPNRMVFVKNGTTFYTGANANARLVFGGVVKGENVGGLAYSTNTTFRVRDNWAGTTVLSPGADRTNDLGRLIVLGALEVTNGVTMIASASAGTTVNDAMLYVSAGNAAGSGTKGRLLVKDGGVLSTPQTSTRYVIMANYGQADICGGTVDMPNVEWRNAQNNPSLTTIRDGGMLDVRNFRLAHNVAGDPTVVRLATNGLLRCNQITLDTSVTTTATFLFDGGYLHPTVANNSFCASGLNSAWDKITFAVGPGGAGFETALDDNVNIYIYRPLVSGVAEGKDGGLMVRGPKGTAVCLMTAQFYNGPTTIDTNELQQRSGDNLLPAGTDIILKNGGILALWTYGQGGGAARATAATLGGVSGNGTVRYATAATFTGTFAPSIGGTIRFLEAPKRLSGTLAITGDSTGCGKVKFDYVQDLSTLSLSVADIASFDKNAAKDRYKIVEGNYTGCFKSVSGLPDDWAVSYRASGIYLSHIDAFVLVVR